MIGGTMPGIKKEEGGGSEVWARCNSSGHTPPVVGWRVPWNAPKPEPGLLTVKEFNKSGAAPAPTGSVAKVPATGGTAAASPSQDARVKKATNQVDNVEKSAKAVVARAKGLTKDSDQQVLKKMQDSLTEEQKKLERGFPCNV